MSKYRVEMTDEFGFVLSRQTFDTKKEMEDHIEGLKGYADEIFKHTSRKMLRLVRYNMPEDDWVEGDVESIFM